MSVIGFRPASAPLRVPTFALGVGRPQANRLIDLGVLLFSAVMLWAMRAEGGGETVPYHLLFVVLTVAYGFRVWPLLPTLAVVVAVTASTGLIMYDAYRRGLIDVAELYEIPLMPALFFAMVWHARRRASAQQAVQEMADHQQVLLERERNFLRNTSHAIRTPVTIARGHLELSELSISAPQALEDVQVALRQLDRVSVLSHRLLALAQLDAGESPPVERIDLRTFVSGLGRDWASSESRNWTITCSGDGEALADPAWLGLAVDALIENALHFTHDRGHIAITGSVTPSHVTIGVADDGPGIASTDLDHVFERFWHRRPPNGPMGSGLGLAMARATARAAGGDVRAHNSDAGGAVIELSLPRLVAPADRDRY